MSALHDAYAGTEPLHLTTDRPDWMHRAECKGMPANWFFPVRGYSGSSRAINICARCPVAAECGAYADEMFEEFGIWGGVRYTQRSTRRRYAWLKSLTETHDHGAATAAQGTEVA